MKKLFTLLAVIITFSLNALKEQQSEIDELKIIVKQFMSSKN